MSNNVGAELEELFGLFTTQLLNEVKVAVAEGLPIPAADKAAIIRFLQINNMAYTPGDNDALLALREQLMLKQSAANGSALAALKDSENDILALYGGKLQ